MQPTEPPTFHPTVWPAEPPAVPGVFRFRLTPVPGTGALEQSRVLAYKDLPPDFVLRELLEDDMAGGSAEAVAASAAAWGLAGEMGGASFQWLPSADPLEKQRAELREWSVGRQNLIHPDVVTFHLRALRSLARWFLAYAEGAGEEAEVAAWHELGEDAPVDVDEARLAFGFFLNAGLSAFAVHVRLAEHAQVGVPLPNLYTSGCLQLARYLAAGSPAVHRCANERCGLPFTVQRGTVKYGQYRGRGVRYCTALCAKAQNERARRRRRREALGGTS